MNLWHESLDELLRIETDLGDSATADRRIELVKARALLSISQELSSINPQNTSYTGTDGEKRNGWGMATFDR